MSYNSIFDKAPEGGNPFGGKFFAFREIGDQVEGTLIGRYDAVDRYGHEQLVMVLKSKDGSINNVGIRKTSTILIERTNPIQLGQIVGFRFDERRPSKRYPEKNANIINVYHDPKVVDSEWLQSQSSAGAPAVDVTKILPTQPSIAQSPVQRSAPPAAKPLSAAVPSSPDTLENTPLDAVRNFAVSLGLTTTEMSLEEQNAKITAATGLEMSTNNMVQLVSKLGELK